MLPSLVILAGPDFYNLDLDNVILFDHEDLFSFL